MSGAEVYRGDGYAAVLTGHFLQRRAARAAQGVCVPFDRIFRAVRRFPYRDCRALLQDRFWVVVKYEKRRNRVIFKTLMPKDYILPAPSVWVAI